MIPEPFCFYVHDTPFRLLLAMCDATNAAAPRIWEADEFDFFSSSAE